VTSTGHEAPNYAVSFSTLFLAPLTQISPKTPNCKTKQLFIVTKE